MSEVNSSPDASPVPKIKSEPVRKSGQSKANGKRVARGTSRRPPSPEIDDSGSDEEPSSNPKAKSNGKSAREAVDDEEEDDNDMEPQSRKRLKGANGRPRQSEVRDIKEDDDDEDNAEARRATKIFVRDPKDGYLPGSIFRICCQNFLTYDFVQFSPGPRMNMILGPNGTGKSTIACAICIGLGFPINTLGRANELHSFVKHGYDQGYVEIELKGPIGKPNIVIRRNISAKNNTSSWLLNGKTSNKSSVEIAVAKSDVQVANLCSFLPQDRVNEFAKLKPEELLVETQKVAGHKKLNDWHNQLIRASEDLRVIKETLDAERKECKDEEGKNLLLERDVAAFKRRKKLEEDLALYTILVHWYRCKADKLAYKDLRMRWKDSGLRLTTAMEEHRPISEYRAKVVKELEAANKEVKAAQNASTKITNDVEKLKNQDKDLSKECTDIQDNIASLHRDEEQSKKTIKRLKDNIAKYETQIEDFEGNPEEEAAPLIASREDLSRQKNALNMQSRRVEESIQEKENSIHQAEQDSRRAREGLQKLGNPRDQRISRMSNNNDPKFRNIADPLFMRAYHWLGENKHQFKSIVEPACFSMDVIDPKYSYAIEGIISVAQMKTFIFEHKEDYEKFNKIFDTNPLGLQSREWRPTAWYRPEATQEHPLPPPERTDEEIKEAGFDGYAIDFVRAPPAVVWFLTRQLEFHRIAISIKQNAVNPERASRMFSPSTPGTTVRYIIGYTLFAIMRSPYGRRLVQNSTSNINKTDWYNTQPVDAQKTREFEGMISLAQDLIRTTNEELAQLRVEEDGFREREQVLERRKAEVAKQINVIQKKVTRLKSLQSSLNNDRQLLAAEENRPNVEQKKKALRTNLVRKVNARLRAINKYKETITALNAQMEIFTKASYHALQATADIAELDKIIDAHKARHVVLQREVDTLGNEMAALKTALSERTTKTVELVKSATPEVKARQEEYTSEHGEQADIEELEQAETNAKAQLELTGQVNKGVIKIYEERQTKIERLQHSIQDSEVRKSNLERGIATVKSKWQPELNKLVNEVNTRFSAAFDRIHCAGEVRIAENEEDYAKWSIEILVKFRSNEPLQLLTGQRQSGGERSLTTILYLMSLTGLAKTPFALVDEINQGMDMKYERAVHNELIQVTCAEDSGQYFLITPKLLPNLTYHENVTTLIINNGDYLPETKDKKGKIHNYGDLAANLAAYRKQLRKS
ncbi:hypothetical protein M408DRAFT_330371 [Serendipita vermifera MAFF 305830]|uniref:Structural maintenance of chromosomes protein 5 n=1 Tax=Serendipita vermifera MAFF 305830 TaxID=933852 RepID=A0A0C3AQA9_SERVB|nr:hypothetical protein M408DRAFT_330371 [Serendipita vermifera MAFF 305830]